MSINTDHYFLKYVKHISIHTKYSAVLLLEKHFYYYYKHFRLLNIYIIIYQSWIDFLWIADNLFIFLRVKNEQKQFLLVWVTA